MKFHQGTSNFIIVGWMRKNTFMPVSMLLGVIHNSDHTRNYTWMLTKRTHIYLYDQIPIQVFTCIGAII